MIAGVMNCGIRITSVFSRGTWTSLATSKLRYLKSVKLKNTDTCYHFNLGF
jgi:hypothetical protein